MVVSHFLGTAVPLCTPHILADIVVEIDMGTQVITHSPNAKHYAAHIVALYRYLAWGSWSGERERSRDSGESESGNEVN